MANRKRTPKETETAVLVKSRRRCCLCFFLENDAAEKMGQIAHIDRDPSNAADDNLAFLCLVHHARYDGKTSQSKGLTPEEVKHARAKLEEWVVRHFFVAAASPEVPTPTQLVTRESLEPKSCPQCGATHQAFFVRPFHEWFPNLPDQTNAYAPGNWRCCGYCALRWPRPKNDDSARSYFEREGPSIRAQRDVAAMRARVCFDCAAKGLPDKEVPAWFTESRKRSWGDKRLWRTGGQPVCLWHISEGIYEKPKGNAVGESDERTWRGETRAHWIERMKREGKPLPPKWEYPDPRRGDGGATP